MSKATIGKRGGRSLKRIVRPRTNNLAATVFVFEGTRKPHETHVVYLDQASCYVDHPGWKHTATLEPAVWIEHLMNNPADREKQIESLRYRPNNEVSDGGPLATESTETRTRRSLH